MIDPGTDNLASTASPILSDDAFLDLHDQRTGLVPYSLSDDRQVLIWIDLKRYHIYEGRFRMAARAAPVIHAAAGGDNRPGFIASSLAVLDQLHITDQYLPPTAFIFGVARCGSTLLTRALARCRSTISYGEPPLPAGLWEFSPDGTVRGDERMVAQIRKIILLMGRKRHPAYQRMYIKFSSVELHAAPVLQAAFPATPCLYLYRHPVEILTSQMAKPTGWLKLRHTQSGRVLAGSATTTSDLDYYSRVLARFYRTALSGQSTGWHLLDYRHITAGNFARIANTLNSGFTGTETSEMQRTFATYSKHEYRNIPFDTAQEQQTRVPSAEILAAAKGELTELYQQLATDPRNLFETSDRRGKDNRGW